MSRTRRDSESTLVDGNDGIRQPLLAPVSTRYPMLPRTHVIRPGRSNLRQPGFIIAPRTIPRSYETIEEVPRYDQPQSNSSSFYWRRQIWLIIAVLLHMHVVASMIVVIFDPATAKRDPWVLGLALLAGTFEFGILWAIFVVNLIREVGKP